MAKRRGLTRKMCSLQRNAASILHPPTLLNDTVKPQIKNSTLPEVPNDKYGAVHLTHDHNTELLCFTMKLSFDPGKPKTLQDAMKGLDVQHWKDAIANEIMNFI